MPICANIKKTIDEITAADKDRKFIIQPSRAVIKSHPYYSHIQFQMYLCGVASFDLAVHTTDFHICPVAFDYDYAIILTRKVETFFEMHILLEFASTDIETRLLTKHTTLWCTCQTPESGQMIECANDQYNAKSPICPVLD